MKRGELKELHYITHMENVRSILKNGILCYEKARPLTHRSVAMQKIQDLRARIKIPGGKALHEYANLYICGRNPMLYKRLDQRDCLCVLQISCNVLDLPGVVITDQNASSKYVRFCRSPDGLAVVNKERTFAERWTDSEDDEIAYWRQKSAKCAEVLVPERVPPKYILGAYVASLEAKLAFDKLGTSLRPTIDRHLFFL